MQTTIIDESITMESVKRDLPDIDVRMPDGPTTRCRIANRGGSFALAYLPVGTTECAWTTIVRCLRTNQPVAY